MKDCDNKFDRRRTDEIKNKRRKRLLGVGEDECHEEREVGGTTERKKRGERRWKENGIEWNENVNRVE